VSEIQVLQDIQIKRCFEGKKILITGGRFTTPLSGICKKIFVDINGLTIVVDNNIIFSVTPTVMEPKCIISRYGVMFEVVN
jgi:hypothetical protein